MLSWHRLRARVRLLSRENFRRRSNSWELRSVTWTLRSVEQRNSWLHKVSHHMHYGLGIWSGHITPLTVSVGGRQKASSYAAVCFAYIVQQYFKCQCFPLFTNRAVHQPYLGPGRGQPAQRAAPTSLQAALHLGSEGALWWHTKDQRALPGTGTNGQVRQNIDSLSKIKSKEVGSLTHAYQSYNT